MLGELSCVVRVRVSGPRTKDVPGSAPLLGGPSIPDGFAPPLHSVSVKQAFRRLFRHPFDYLIRRWNWKSAILSSLLRAAIFFFANLSAGLNAAVAAMNTEFLFRGVTSGFYGAFTENFREAEPPWAAALTVMVFLPLVAHSVEFLVHWLRGTQKLVPSIISSVVFTALSTLFNLYAMRRGALVVGIHKRSLSHDLRRIPRLLLEFITLLPRLALRGLRKRNHVALLTCSAMQRSKSEKQIPAQAGKPHPAETAGIRDDRYGEARAQNRKSTEPNHVH